MEDKVEFEVLEAKLLGSDTVVYKLEDKTEIKIRVDIARVGVAKNFENPDGTPRYPIDTNLQISFVPASKKFHILKSRLKVPPPLKSRNLNQSDNFYMHAGRRSEAVPKAKIASKKTSGIIQ